MSVTHIASRALGPVVECLEALRRVISWFEEARRSPRSVTVTEVARRIASPRSHGGSAEAGRRAHNVWGDPFDACSRAEHWTPLPLAYRLEGVWIYGVADLVRFVNGVPLEVVELKYYESPDRYSIAQVRIYAWLTARCFACRPRAYLVLGWDGRRYGHRLEVKYTPEEVEEEVKSVLRRLEGLSKA
ncbi:MAG: hypothetical protein J7L75_04110 [Thermoproteales archaeon]|nr:hypothetical protein [Thermoproteales archaeon]